jgi:hypothetical protein
LRTNGRFQPDAAQAARRLHGTPDARESRILPETGPLGLPARRFRLPSIGDKAR